MKNQNLTTKCFSSGYKKNKTLSYLIDWGKSVLVNGRTYNMHVKACQWVTHILRAGVRGHLCMMKILTQSMSNCIMLVIKVIESRWKHKPM